MPFYQRFLAKTTGDGSCGLHCFVPTVMKILQNANNTHTKEKADLAKEFQDYYEIANKRNPDGSPNNFNGDSLRLLLDDLNQKEREAVLEPILRKMMVASKRSDNTLGSNARAKADLDTRLATLANSFVYIDENELRYLADSLGVRLQVFANDNDEEIHAENYDEHFNVNYRPNRNNHPYRLKIRHRNRNHWEFEMNFSKKAKNKKALLDRHNAYYENTSPQYIKFHSQNLALALRTHVKTAVARGQSLKNIFSMPGVIDNNRYESNEVSTNISGSTNPTAKGDFGRIISLIDNFVKSISGNSTGKTDKSGKNEDMFAGLFSIFANIFKAILGVMELGTQIGKVNSHEATDELLDSLSEEARAETLDFQSYTSLLTNAGGTAQISASNLNKEWVRNIKDPDRTTDTLWLKLIEILQSQGKSKIAFELLKKREQVLIKRLENPDSSQRGSAGITKVVADKFKAVVDNLNSLDNKAELAKADQTDQLACVESRLDMFKKLIGTSCSDAEIDSFDTQFKAHIKACKEARLAKEAAAKPAVKNDGATTVRDATSGAAAAFGHSKNAFDSKAAAVHSAMNSAMNSGAADPKAAALKDASRAQADVIRALSAAVPLRFASQVGSSHPQGVASSQLAAGSSTSGKDKSRGPSPARVK